MEVQKLKVLVTEEDANELVKNHVPDTGAIEDLRVRLTPEGVIVQGQYPILMCRVPFETQWELTAAGPELVARLASVRVSGLPAGILKGALMGVVRDQAGNEPGLRVQEDSIHINVAEAARAHGVPLRINFTAVRCGAASLVLEAGTEVG
jgi:hypothetical protein